MFQKKPFKVVSYEHATGNISWRSIQLTTTPYYPSQIYWYIFTMTAFKAIMKYLSFDIPLVNIFSFMSDSNVSKYEFDSLLPFVILEVFYISFELKLRHIKQHKDSE